MLLKKLLMYFQETHVVYVLYSLHKKNVTVPFDRSSGHIIVSINGFNVICIQVGPAKARFFGSMKICPVY